MTTPVSPSAYHENFYNSLIKAPISLDIRAQLANILSESARQQNVDLWNKIKSKKNQFNQYLTLFKDRGYLPITLSSSNNLASELLALPHSGLGSYEYGRQREVEKLENVRELPSVKTILNDQMLYYLVSLYLNAPAYLHTCQAWWQYPLGPKHKPSNAQLWHRDRDDLAELKLFFYATDVTITSGPHAFIPYTHTVEGLTKIFPDYALKNEIINGSSNKFVEDDFLFTNGLKSKAIKQWLGKAGTCFLEDTRGFHRAYVPSKEPRLIFNLVWTVGRGYKHNIGSQMVV